MHNRITGRPETVIEHTCMLGEGPVWDHRRNLVCWIDILNGAIHEYSPALKTHRSLDVHELIGSVAICNNGDFIAALQNGFAFIDRVTGEIKRIADPEMHLPNNRFNEGKCDPAGRFWAGTMSVSEEPGAGNLYVMQHDYSPVKKLGGISISNGMAWSLDHRILYYIDTPTFEIVAYDYEKATGHIDNRRTIIRMASIEGFPDGMTIDDEGMLWVAHWDGWQVTRWDPVSGKKIDQIAMPVSRVTSCTFGGDQLQDLYISSAKTGLSSHALKQQPLAGSLFVIRDCGFRGVAAFEFAVGS